MDRTISITFHGERVDNDELADLSRDITEFMVDQLAFDSADLTVVGVRGRYGAKGYTATVERKT